MSRSVWLLVFSVCSLNMIHGGITDFFNGINQSICKGIYLSIIKEVGRKTSVKMSDTTNNVEWCNKSRRRRAAVFVDEIDLEGLIALYTNFDGVNSFSGARNSPVESYGLLIAPNNERLPVYIVADIRRRHFPRPNTPAVFDDDVADQMRYMGALDSDERGHLLAHSLGGSSSALNVVPMARNLNRHYDYRSYWRSNEDWILRFLRNYPRGRVSWRLVVHYDDDVVLNPNAYHSMRPRGFTLQYTAYTNARDDESVYYTTETITYINDNDAFCTPLNRVRRSAGFNCPTPKAKTLKGTMGDEKSRGRWAQRYKVGFHYTIEGKHYFYGQSIIDGSNYFIQELLPDGKMGTETGHGFLEENYHRVFPFRIEDKQYFYGQSFDSYNWAIRELTADGKIGRKTSSGRWNERYMAIFPFTIEGKYFFFGQSIMDGHNYFIQELKSDGTMGSETDHGFLDENYHVMVPIMTKGRQYFYGQSHDSRNWIVRELKSDGKLGPEVSRSRWNQRYEVSFAYQYHGKTFLYGQSILDGKNWFIQELKSGGQVSSEISHGFLDANYHISFPYQIDGRQYFYGHSNDDRSWIIRELL